MPILVLAFGRAGIAEWNLVNARAEYHEVPVSDGSCLRPLGIEGF